MTPTSRSARGVTRLFARKARRRRPQCTNLPTSPAPHLHPRLAAPATAQAACVVVVHGLWLHGFVMARFCARLRRSGFRAVTFSYPSLRQPATENAAALAQFIAGLQARHIHIVAHSLGGLISLLYTQSHPDPRLGRVVLLGAPVTGSAVARRLASSRVGQWFLGQARATLVGGIGTHASTGLPQGISIGVIAGTLGVGLGRLVMTLRDEHDGTVQVAETRLPGAADFLTLPVSHTGMMFSARVAEAVAGFLRAGRFPRAPG